MPEGQEKENGKSPPSDHRSLNLSYLPYQVPRPIHDELRMQCVMQLERGSLREVAVPTVTKSLARLFYARLVSVVEAPVVLKAMRSRGNAVERLMTSVN